MAELLKNWFNKAFVQNIGSSIKSVKNDFNDVEFIDRVIDKSWEKRELKERMRHISVGLNDALELPYDQATEVLNKVVDQFEGLTAMVFPDFVEVYGLDHLELSLDTLEYYTQFSSSEFAIRPFILRNTDEVMKRMHDWSTHPNHHVRRLASEGCRPRLPWAIALPEFKQDPSLILPILENLKNDESEYVRKSVANNINDISKDNPETAIKLVKSWYGHSKYTDWIIKHGMRGLLKKGHKAALDLFGLNENAKVNITKFHLSDGQVKMGQYVHFDFEMCHYEVKEVFLKVAYAIDYVKSNGKHSRKLFHITEKKFTPALSYRFKKKVSFKDLTTRKHYPGPHILNIVINGKVIASKNFTLL